MLVTSLQQAIGEVPLRMVIDKRRNGLLVPRRPSILDYTVADRSWIASDRFLLRRARVFQSDRSISSFSMARLMLSNPDDCAPLLRRAARVLRAASSCYSGGQRPSRRRVASPRAP